MATIPLRPLRPGEQPPDPSELIAEDGVPLESDWHRRAMNLLIEVVRWHLRDRTDYFCGGNMFIYFSPEQARNRDFRGPDVFYVSGVPFDRERPWYAVWDEGRYPDVIIELTSPSTEDEDRTTKFEIYEQTFRTPDYFIYDPQSGHLAGWRLTAGRYVPLRPNDRGWLWCQELNLWLGLWQGPFLQTVAIYPRFFDGDGNLVPISAEASEARRQEAEDRRHHAEELRQEAEDRRQEAEARLHAAERARQTAEAGRRAEEKARHELEARLTAMQDELDRLRRGGKGD